MSPARRGSGDHAITDHHSRAIYPKHIAEKILSSKAALEGERKRVTVLFADLKGSMELLADRDPEESRKILDPALELMMKAVHRYEGTVNQVMGDGIMALFGAPLAHGDHGVRACYAALRMQESVQKYADEVRRTHAAVVKIRVGLNSGEVVVRAIGSDLHMDYTAVGQTTHLAARMEQFASPGTTLLTPATLELVEGFVAVKPLGSIPVKGLADAECLRPLPRVTARAFDSCRHSDTSASGLSHGAGRLKVEETLRSSLRDCQGGSWRMLLFYRNVIPYCSVRVSPHQDIGDPHDEPKGSAAAGCSRRCSRARRRTRGGPPPCA
jgi:class 3 adenylate cyclase